jgi:Domain of unknown function (DUF4397)
MRINTFTALLACVVVGVINAPPVLAEPAPSAMLRGAHFSPDTPSVDVYLTSFAGGSTKLALSDVGYGAVSDYSRLAPGQYTVGMRPAGADPSTPVVFSWTLDAKPGEAFTALAIGMNKSLQGRVLSDDLTPPPTGQSRVRIVQAAHNAPRADITTANGPVFGKAVSFTTTTGYTVVPSGSWPVTAAATDNPSLRTTSDATLVAGRSSTIVLLDGPSGGLTVKVVDDAIGTDYRPAGPVQAGGGWTAMAGQKARGMRSAAFAMTGIAVLATLLLLGLTLRRSRIR